MPGYENERQPYDDAAELRALIDGAHTEDASGRYHPGPWQRLRSEYLTEALTRAGVELGEFDRKETFWLSGGELVTVQVIARWVADAYAAGAKAGTAPAAAPAPRCHAARLLEDDEPCEGNVDAVRLFRGYRIPSDEEKRSEGLLACVLHGGRYYAGGSTRVYPNGGNGGPNSGKAIEVYQRGEAIRESKGLTR